DDLLESQRRIGLVADERDRLDAGPTTLLDLEHEIDASVRQLDDLGLDVDIETTIAAIDVSYADSVGLHHRARQRARRLRLQLASQLIVLDVLVALECDPVDHRILHDGHDQTIARTIDAHVLEQAAGNQLFETRVDGRGVQPPARWGAEVGADRIG